MSLLGVMGGARGAVNAYSNSSLTKQAIFDIGTNENYYKDFLTKQYQERGLTQEEYNEKMRLVNTAAMAKQTWNRAKGSPKAMGQKGPQLAKTGAAFVQARANEIALLKDNTNPQLAESEKIQKRINDNIEGQKKSLEESAKASQQFTEKQLESISREFEARRAKEGDSKKLDQEEIEAKKNVLKNNIETNDLQIAANKKTLEDAKAISEKKIKILEDEVKKQFALAVKQTAGTAGGNINTSGADQAQKRLANAKVEHANQINNLKLFNGQLIDENKGLIDGLNELDRQQKNKESEANKEADEESKRDREKRLKEALAFKELLLSDKYNLKAAELKSNIETEKELLNNTKVEFRYLRPYSQNSLSRVQSNLENRSRLLGFCRLGLFLTFLLLKVDVPVEPQCLYGYLQTVVLVPVLLDLNQGSQ